MPFPAYISTGQIMGWGNKAIEIRGVETGHLDGVFMHKKAQKLKFLCERNDKVTSPSSCRPLPILILHPGLLLVRQGRRGLPDLLHDPRQAGAPELVAQSQPWMPSFPTLGLPPSPPLLGCSLNWTDWC